MSFSDVFLIVPSAVASGFIWFFLLTAVFYFARNPAHKALRSFSRVIHNAMRVSANSVLRAEKLLAERNREVLLAAGREASERIIEREFHRIDATVRRDLADYPTLHRKLTEEITHIDDDYQESTEVPPAPPGWVKAVEAVAKIPVAKGDPTVSNILEDIHGSMIKANTVATEEYRKASHKRHMMLNKMMPHWRKLLLLIGEVDKSINSLLDRSKIIDHHMDEYENILKRSDRALRTLSSSSLTQFFVSAFVLTIAVGGAIINFNLISLPMSEMVGGKSQILGFYTHDVAALVIILVELSLGIFLMESMRITRLFPVIGALDDKLRVKMIWITFGFLFALASVEAGLAFMREIMMEESQATRAVLRGDEAASVTGSSYLWITTAAQMGLGFILPFALTFVAIPLESFVHSSRTVLGILGVWTLRTLATVLRLLGNIARFFSSMLIHVYDLIIFGPLWIEKMVVKGRKHQDDASESESSISIGGGAA